MEPTFYLFFDGDCADALDFYSKHIGAEVLSMMRNSDAPETDRVSGNQNLVMNAIFRMGNTTMMASDSPAKFYSPPQGFNISINPKTVEEAEKLWAIFSVGAKINMELSETFWADRFGMLIDKFGIPWMFNCVGSKAPAPAPKAKSAKARLNATDAKQPIEPKTVIDDIKPVIAAKAKVAKPKTKG